MAFDMKTCVIIGILVIIVMVIYFCMRKKETYSNINSMDNLGSLDTSYEMVQSPEQAVPAAQFADMVGHGNLSQFVNQPKESAGAIRPVERLNRVHNSKLLPATAANVIPYDVDVANIKTYSYAVTPRVNLKNRVWQAADPYRGDIPISFHPEVCLVSSSQFGRDATRLDGYFSSAFESMHNRNVGKAYKNMPFKVAAGGTIMDY